MRRGLDLVDDPFQDAAIPPRRLAVPGDAVAGVPLPAVDLPGGLGLLGDSGFQIPDSRFQIRLSGLRLRAFPFSACSLW